ncbi:hypothetical protein G7Z17_g2297 [Cylindrodendrum hubeiense]|uniref:MARVEL domain-containing protein n=1 Tax=Cylindrodendrum hubeiense TaxID=595255 RepID=A0A9P5LEL8_9HYPO|nr:hypothetical protein G7Z17_g2297 [Cylindrodendrum hubeiense]
MAISKIVSMAFRGVELVIALGVAALTADYIRNSHLSPWKLRQFIYIATVAGLSVFFAFIWLLPFKGTFMNWPFDAGISLLWGVATGLLYVYLDKNCDKDFLESSIDLKNSTADLKNFKIDLKGSQCDKFKADFIFAAISVAFWLGSALIGYFWVRRNFISAKKAAKKGNKRRNHV